MQQINNLSDQPNQVTHVTLADGTTADIYLTYRPRLQRWTLSVNHPTLTSNGMTLCVHPNILRQWKNIASFGLAVVSSDGLDPFYITDFSNGRVSLFVLSASEATQIEQNIYGNPLA